MASDPRTAAPDDATDVFEDALGSIFGLSQPAEGAAHAELAFAHPALARPVHFSVPDVTAANAKIAAQYQWASGRIMAQLLADVRLGHGDELGALPSPSPLPRASLSTAHPAPNAPANAAIAPLDVRGRAVVELGSGTGLPSLVVAQLGARMALATDYPDESLLTCLAANVERNRPAPTADCGDNTHTHTGVQPLLWGDTAHIAAAQGFSGGSGFDLLLCSDVLWMTSAHEPLLATLRALMTPQGRVLIISGLHTGRRPVATFLTLAARAGLVPDWQAPAQGVWERFHAPGGTAHCVPWRGHPDLPRFSGQSLSMPVPQPEHDALEPDYDERAHWSICALLRRI